MKYNDRWGEGEDETLWEIKISFQFKRFGKWTTRYENKIAKKER